MAETVSHYHKATKAITTTRTTVTFKKFPKARPVSGTRYQINSQLLQPMLNCS